MRNPTSTAVVAEDLRRLFNELNSSRRYPERFRRAFDQYVYKSQQLTEVMRREYSNLCNKKWDAATFDGWNPYTNAMKAIRNATYHGVPLVFYEVTYAIYPAIKFATDDEEPDSELLDRGYKVIESVSFIELPFSEKFLTPHVGHPISQSPKGINDFVFPIKEYVTYKFQWDLLESGVRNALDKAGTNDAVKLLLKTHPALMKYFHYYVEQRELHRLI